VPELSEIQAWLDFDPDEKDRKQIQNWLDTNNELELNKSFQGLLEFGTAGLRGPVRPGPSGMNRAVVAKAAMGIAAYAKARGLKKVIIGRDARYGSLEFMNESAEIFSGAGLEVFLMPAALPTPLLAFAVNHLSMDIGIMVTASHNPGGDNGYKVYLGGEVDGINYRGSQIISPTDSYIAKEINAANKISERGNNWITLDNSIVDSYIAETSKLVNRGSDLKIVYTAMHGVGKEVTVKLFNKVGFTNLHLVAAQAEPDPDFPTVAFPNPEEEGAMDLSLAFAKEIDANIILANDPDADRCAVAIKLSDGSYRQLRGDEVGILIGYYLAAKSNKDLGGKAFANSIVSSSALGKIAQKYQINFSETLTGFKYLAKIPNLAFGYEEALGYAIDATNVNDKDGISAALYLAHIASELHLEGLTISDLISEIWNVIGFHFNSSNSIRFTEISEIPKFMEKLRNSPLSKIGDYSVTSVEDLAKPLNNLPPTNGLRYFLNFQGNERGIRVIIRPSGTEPKIKVYLEIVGRDSSLAQQNLCQEVAVELAMVFKVMAN
jgi:phosphomannomutase